MYALYPKKSGLDAENDVQSPYLGLGVVVAAECMDEDRAAAGNTALDAGAAGLPWSLSGVSRHCCRRGFSSGPGGVKSPAGLGCVAGAGKFTGKTQMVTSVGSARCSQSARADLRCSAPPLCDFHVLAEHSTWSHARSVSACTKDGSSHHPWMQSAVPGTK